LCRGYGDDGTCSLQAFDGIIKQYDSAAPVDGIRFRIRKTRFSVIAEERVIVSRKPRDSRVVQKRLTVEKKSSKYDIISMTCQSKLKTYLEDLSMKNIPIDNNSLAHTSWNCKYHIVFAPKYRRKVFFAEKRLEIREILRQLCQWKGVEIIEGEVCPDHIHMLVSIPPKMSVSGFMGYLKGKSALLIFQKFGNMKFAYRNREFWCKGYYVDTVGKNTKAIKQYIADQLKRDQESDQLAMFDPRDPFMGSK